VAGVVVLALAAAVMSPVTTARAADFYTPPATVDASPGTVLRAESMLFYLDPLRLVPSNAHATRVMYATRDRGGAPIAVTGTVLVPPLPWAGVGQRPVVGYAAGTQGLVTSAPRAASSRPAPSTRAPSSPACWPAGMPSR
jgi:hypothetical protein